MRPTVRDIIAHVAKDAGLPFGAMTWPDRGRRIVLVRRRAVWVTRIIHPRMSLVALGTRFGCDHTTIHHRFHRYEITRLNDADERRLSDRLVAELGGPGTAIAPIDPTDALVLAAALAGADLAEAASYAGVSGVAASLRLARIGRAIHAIVEGARHGAAA